MPSFYVTTPIYYANSLPHFGHLYTTVVADCLKRHYGQRGFETCFLTGMDEHGLNIQRTAARLGRTPPPLARARLELEVPHVHRVQKGRRGAVQGRNCLAPTPL